MAEKKLKIKLFVTYHDDHCRLKSSIIEPIQTGRATAPEIFPGMTGDDTGDNISRLNASFCELTAHYWAWKNYQDIGDPDYIGFMHYRRVMQFNPDLTTPPVYPGNNPLPQLSSCRAAMPYVDDEHIAATMRQYDVVHPRYFRIGELLPGADSARSEFGILKGQELKLWDLMAEVMEEKYPEYHREILEMKSPQSVVSMYTMFAMRKDIFMEYAAWLFDILFTVAERADSSYLNVFENRRLGYLGEHLTSIFIRHLESRSGLRIGVLPLLFIFHPDEIAGLKSIRLNYWKNLLRATLLPSGCHASSRYKYKTAMYRDILKQYSNSTR